MPGKWPDSSTNTVTVRKSGWYRLPTESRLPSLTSHAFWGLTAAICALGDLLASSRHRCYPFAEIGRAVQFARLLQRSFATISDVRRNELNEQAEDLARMSADKARIAEDIARATA
jgi:hypothetical protein